MSSAPHAERLAPRNLTPGLCRRAAQKKAKACQDVAARHGLVVEGRKIAAVDLRRGFDLSFRVSIPLADGTALDPERLRFEAMAEAFRLSESRFGR